jgi:hypothetical protein
MGTIISEDHTLQVLCDPEGSVFRRKLVTTNRPLNAIDLTQKTAILNQLMNTFTTRRI